MENEEYILSEKQILFIKRIIGSFSKNKKTYRNRFFVYRNNTEDIEILDELVLNGFCVKKEMTESNIVYYYATQKGFISVGLN